MTNKKCLLGTIASYSLDVKLAAGDAAAREAIAPTPRLSERSSNAPAVAGPPSEQFDRKFALDREEVLVASDSS
jgi:hypothetical protein